MKIVRNAIFLMVLLQATAAWSWDDGDLQIWHTEQQEFKINDASRITLEEEFRWGDDASDFYYHHYDAGYLYSIHKNVDAGIAVRKIFEEKRREFKEETRPALHLILKVSAAGWKFEDRNRIEHRFVESSKDYGRYRNKITIRPPVQWSRFKLQPFAADEIFIDLDKANLSRNRLSSGITATIAKNVKAEAYYLLQSTKSSGVWSDLNVLGLKLKVNF